MLMVQPPFPVDNSPLCTIQVQQIVTSSGLKRWRSAGPIREVRRMDRMSFWLASSRWRGWQWPAEHPQQPRVCHIGHGSIPSKKNDPYRSPTVAAPVLGTFPQSIFKCAKHRACVASAPWWRIFQSATARGHGVRRLDPGPFRQAGEEGVVWPDPTAACRCPCPNSTKNHNPSGASPGSGPPHRSECTCGAGD